jgi:hypothetical protein
MVASPRRSPPVACSTAAPSSWTTSRGVQVRGVAEGGRDIEDGGVALLQAVGQEEDPVSQLKRELLRSQRRAGHDTERRFDAQTDLLHPTIPQPKRQRVTGVDDRGRAGRQVHAQELSGDEPPRARILGQGVIGVQGLGGEVQAPPAGVAQPPTNSVASKAASTSDQQRIRLGMCGMPPAEVARRAPGYG